MIRYTLLIFGALLLVVSGALGWARREEARSSYLLAFTINRGRQFDLYLMSPQGGPARRLTALPGTDEYYPAWSPDGRWIAFAGVDIQDLFINLWRVRPSGQDLRALTAIREGFRTKPAWSPGGGEIFYSSNEGGWHEVWRMDSNGRRARPFFDEPSYRGWPVWSWGGDWLYFIELDSYTLARMRPDGSGRERLNDFPHPEAYQGLAVGPDESLWYSYRQAEGYLQIYHWRPGESQTWALPNPSQASQVWPAPSPDGRHLYYIQADRLMRFDLAAQTAQDISPGGAYKYNSPAPSPIIALAWGGWLNLSAGLGLLMLGLWRVYVQS